MIGVMDALFSGLCGFEKATLWCLMFEAQIHREFYELLCLRSGK